MAEQIENYASKASENNNFLPDAVENVLTTVHETESLSEIYSHEEEIFYQSPEFWVGFAFILVVIGLIKPLSRMLRNMLLKRRDEIIDQITQAEQLRNDARKLLAEYEKKFVHVKDEANEILDRSEKEIAFLKNEELQKLERVLEQRRKEVENSITLSIEKVKSEINTTVTALALDKVKQYIQLQLTATDHSKLIDKSLDRILKSVSSKK